MRSLQIGASIVMFHYNMTLIDLSRGFSALYEHVLKTLFFFP
ncbi:hypothetical protein CUS_5640 [Ruminococcus albus 8]|uniref:Uncharacterized protein n=1 Tax=Ruminococcus albus 8 TaxID=246199 RepID=E9S8Z5_RUMAL|nr:hypothetical protein CUS_5640 [Ruminococcus albus 8]